MSQSNIPVPDDKLEQIDTAISTIRTQCATLSKNAHALDAFIRPPEGWVGQAGDVYRIKACSTSALINEHVNRELHHTELLEQYRHRVQALKDDCAKAQKAATEAHDAYRRDAVSYMDSLKRELERKKSEMLQHLYTTGTNANKYNSISAVVTARGPSSSADAFSLGVQQLGMALSHLDAWTAPTLDFILSPVRIASQVPDFAAGLASTVSSITQHCASAAVDALSGVGQWLSPFACGIIAKIKNGVAWIKQQIEKIFQYLRDKWNDFVCWLRQLWQSTEEEKRAWLEYKEKKSHDLQSIHQHLQNGMTWRDFAIEAILGDWYFLGKAPSLSQLAAVGVEVLPSFVGFPNLITPSLLLLSDFTFNHPGPMHVQPQKMVPPSTDQQRLDRYKEMGVSYDAQGIPIAKDYGGIMALNQTLSDQEKGGVIVQKLIDSAGKTRWVVACVGSDPSLSAAATNPHGNSLPANTQSMGLEYSSPSALLVKEAMAKAGIAPGEPVMFVGHSQGGMVAANLASDPLLREKYTIQAAVTIAGPIDNPEYTGYDNRPPVPVINFEAQGDVVPKLDGGGVRIRPSHHGGYSNNHGNITTIPVPGGTNALESHGLDNYQRGLVSIGKTSEMQAFQNKNMQDFTNCTGAGTTYYAPSHEK